MLDKIHFDRLKKKATLKVGGPIKGKALRSDTVINYVLTPTSEKERHHDYYYHYCFYSYHESGFLSHIYIKVNRIFTQVKKKIKCKRGMSKQSAIARSKPTKKKHKKRPRNRSKTNNTDTRETLFTLLCCHFL